MAAKIRDLQEHIFHSKGFVEGKPSLNQEIPVLKDGASGAPVRLPLRQNPSRRNGRNNPAYSMDLSSPHTTVSLRDRLRNCQFHIRRRELTPLRAGHLTSTMNKPKSLAPSSQAHSRQTNTYLDSSSKNLSRLPSLFRK